MLPPNAAYGDDRIGSMVIHYLAPEGLVLDSLGGCPRIAGRPVGGGDDLGMTEQEQLVGSCGNHRVFVLITTSEVVRELLYGLYLGLEIGRHEVPDLTRVYLRAELGGLPSADAGFRSVHAGRDSHRGGEERQARLT